MDPAAARRAAAPGRARAPIERVEVSADGGATWATRRSARSRSRRRVARLVAATGSAGPGEHELCCRATDAAGASQPLTAGWNLGGYANNGVHRVDVVVD